MSRADFWCRVLGWAHIAGGGIVTTLIFTVARLIGLDLFNEIEAAVIPWLLFFFVALPELMAGIFTLRFAGHVQSAREGVRGKVHIALRVLMGLAGLWSAGVIGLFGLSMPQLGLFSVMGLLTALLAALGPDATADLVRPAGATS